MAKFHTHFHPPESHSHGLKDNPDTHTSTGHGIHGRWRQLSTRPLQPLRAPPTGPMAQRSRPRTPSIRESALSPAERYEHPRPYLDQEVPRPQSGLPGHPAFVHGLQVLQGWERRRRRELLNGRIRWEARTESSLQPGGRVQGGSLTPTGPCEGDPCPLLEVVGPGHQPPGKGLTLTVPDQQQLEP